MVLKVVGVVVGLAVAFVIWRFTSVARGAHRRDELLLGRIDPLLKRLDANEPTSRADVEELAVCSEIRYLLYAVLRNMGRGDLLPERFASSIDQGASALGYWIMHPNELQDPPEVIEFVETVRRPFDGSEADFHVYRYKMAPGHWAGKDRWLLGLAGPMSDEGEPYSELPGAFALAGDTEGKRTAAELVDSYLDLLRRKGLIE